MGSLSENQALAVEVIERLRAGGVRTFCVCPGGRNAPLVEALDSLVSHRPEDLEVLDFFEERSAAFFALGRARRDLRPAAVVTTSGTASAEVLPALIEAYYSGQTVVAVTADRPRSYRGTGAPQTIEQRDLFGVYARQRLDLDRPGTDWRLTVSDGPCHVNVCFDEPLLAGWQPWDRGDEVRAARAPRAHRPQGDGGAEGGERWSGRGEEAGAGQQAGAGADSRATATIALAGCLRPLVLLGAITDPDDQRAALEFCRGLRAPVLAEARSHIRPHLGEWLLRGGEAAARRGVEQGAFDAVVRLGDIPSCRLWRDLELAWRHLPVVSVSRRPWRGLTHGMHLTLPATARLSDALPVLAPFPEAEAREVLAFDRSVAAATDCLLEEFPKSEPALFRRLSREIPPESFVYLGNSLPIREWNQFAVSEDRGFVHGENRGANGIDGQLSTFLGAARGDRENWAIVGDLTALYDLASPWGLQHVAGVVRVVVVNNGGGRIFERMFANPRFQNRHRLEFQAFAALWGMEYREAVPRRESAPAALIELRPDAEQTAAFWKALDGSVRR